MFEPVSLKHSFNAGDLLTLFPSLKRHNKLTGIKFVIYQRLNLPYGEHGTHPTMHEGKTVSMNEEMFNRLKPLIERQECVERFEIWKGEKVHLDIDLTRHHSQMPLPGGEIHYWPTLVFPLLVPDFSEPWIDAPISKTTIQDKIIINRTDRYRNPYITFFFLKEFQDKLVFVGTEKEHQDFNKDWELEIPRENPKNFFGLASLIKSCRFFLGGQSMCWHIADGLQTRRILEVCTNYPNTFPKGKNGYAYLTQNSLEHYFDKLLKETENEKQESETIT